MTKNTIFSDRVKEYSKFRVDYSDDVKNFLALQIISSDKQILADIGSGTGLLAKILLELGAYVFGVEPNDEMRKKGEHNLADYRKFTSIAGSAEHTNLKDDSIDIITAGNAFHWFDSKKARQEFKRILKSDGKIILIRTDWKEYKDEAMAEYDRIICAYCTQRRGIVADILLEKQAIHEFFKTYNIYILKPSIKQYSREDLKGRFLSTSYAPKEGINFNNAMLDLDNLFDKYQHDNKFNFGVVTTIVVGVI
jgi:ubiquinone/menaquinone biosynthesis C-methylase UbiE